MMTAEVLRMKEKEGPEPGGRSPQRVNTVVVGAGQAGLAAGYFLKQRGIDLVILDGAERIGESWRKRWDSLRLFSPARYNELPGKSYPAEPYYYPTKDEHAAYLEAYAEEFDLPVYLNTRVERVIHAAEGYLVFTAVKTYKADHVISAMSSFQIPHIPPFASDLDSAIKQLHSSAYRRPGQLRDGDALVVGAGNSGAEIALDAAADRRTWLSGRHPGQEPFSVESKLTDPFLVPLVLDLLFSRLLTVDTAIGRIPR
jgi:putative flavoprotein involved in K+ transport